MTDFNTIQLRVRHCRKREDEPGIAWGPRTIPDYELILVATGQYTYIDAQGRLDLDPGDMLFIEPEVEHLFRKQHEDGPGTHYCAHFDFIDGQGNVCLIRQLGCTPQRKTPTGNPPPLLRHMQEASHEFRSYSRFHQETVNTIIKQVWLKTAEKWFESGGQQVSEVVKQMMDYLRTHLEAPVTRRDLAQRFHYSPEHINYLFKKELGLTPSRFLNRERVIRAFRYLMEDGLTVQQAATLTGFSCPYYFSRVFKDIFGYPPARIKKYLNRDLDGIFEKHVELS